MLVSSQLKMQYEMNEKILNYFNILIVLPYKDNHPYDIQTGRYHIYHLIMTSLLSSQNIYIRTKYLYSNVQNICTVTVCCGSNHLCIE